MRLSAAARCVAGMMWVACGALQAQAQAQSAAPASNAIDHAAIYAALNVQPVALKHPVRGYKMLSKAVPGFIDCRLSTYENGVQAHQCSFNTHDGFSVADRAYDYLNVKETPLRVDAKGQWTQKRVGGLTCTRVVFAKPLRNMDTVEMDRTVCEVTLRFGPLDEAKLDLTPHRNLFGP